MNLNAFDSRFLSTCSRRFGVGHDDFGSGRRRIPWRNRSLAILGLVAEHALHVTRAARRTAISSQSTVTVPDSILDRSRMSLIRLSRSVPAPWIVLANSTCFAVRLPVEFSLSCWPRMRMLLSGVRSSCDMLARNSDLYFEVSASSVAFSSRARRACSISWFLRSTSAFCSASCCALMASSSLVCCSSFCWLCNSPASCLRLLEQAFGAHRRFDRVEHDADRFGQLIEEQQVRRMERRQRRQFDDRLDLAFEQHRQHDDARSAPPRTVPEVMRMESERHVVEQQAFLFHAALADEPFAEAIFAVLARRRLMCVAGQQLQRGSSPVVPSS